MMVMVNGAEDGGTDCDDADVTIIPAVEVWYDGIVKFR